MKKYIIIASLTLLAASCSKQPPVSSNPPIPSPAPVATSTPAQTATSTPMSLPVKYNNTQYGFIFSLPADWTGFSTYASTWTGNPLAGSQYKSNITGPEIYIRNPKWTIQNPYEDIPVMVFTLAEWTEIQEEKLAVSAAPIPPTELGQNANYVFALPPRYDFDYRTGYQEVEQIIQNNPLQASGTNASPYANQPPINYLVIKDWGVEFQEPAGVNDLIYHDDSLPVSDQDKTQQSVDLSSQQLVSLDKLCEPGSTEVPDSLGLLGRVESLSEFGDRDIPSIRLGGYYYYFITPPAPCSSNSQAQQLETQELSALSESILQTLRLIK